MFKFLLFVSFFTFVNAFAVSEKNVLSEMVSLLDSGEGSFYKKGTYRSQNGLSAQSIEAGKSIPISYTKYGFKKGKKGSVLIVTGRTESSLKYIEVAADLIANGYSPVYAVDHRGQGFSGNTSRKKLPDSQIGHVENFNDYVKDFSQFVRFTLLKDSQVDENNLFLISNSLGGAITLRYFQQNPMNPFKKSALFASMFKIITGDDLALLKTISVCAVMTIGKLDCYGYTPGESPIQWAQTIKLPNGKKIKTRAFRGDDPSYVRNLTSSKSRFYLNDYIMNRWPQTIVAGPTIKWTEQSLLAGNTLRTYGEIKTVKNDIFMLIASRDFRADGPAQRRVCKTIGKKCFSRTYDSYHEILMETDSIRNQALADVLEYFEN